MRVKAAAAGGPGKRLPPGFGLMAVLTLRPAATLGAVSHSILMPRDRWRPVGSFNLSHLGTAGVDAACQFVAVVRAGSSSPSPVSLPEMARELDRQTILAALARLNELLRERAVLGELSLLGGTVMVLAFNARARTKDVDAIFQPAEVIRAAAARIGEELELPAHWLNDGAKGFVSARHEVVEGDLPQFDHLRLTAPTPEYLLAMKCLAARLPAGADERGDEADIRFLARRLGIASAQEAMDLVLRYYPAERIPPRTQFLLEDIFSRPEDRP